MCGRTCQHGFHTEMMRAFKARPQLGFAVWRKTLVDAAIFREASRTTVPACAKADLASVLRTVLSGPRLWPDQAQPACVSRKPRSDRQRAWNFDRHLQSHATTVTCQRCCRLPRRHAYDKDCAPSRSRALASRKRAAGSAARAVRTRASERLAVGQRLGPVLRPSPVLESSPSAGTACGAGRATERIVGSTR